METEETLAHIYEDIDKSGPPRIAPISGVLESSNFRKVLKPVAFKPGLGSSKQMISPVQLKHASPISSYSNIPMPAPVQSPPQPTPTPTPTPPVSLQQPSLPPTSLSPISIKSNNNNLNNNNSINNNNIKNNIINNNNNNHHLHVVHVPTPQPQLITQHQQPPPQCIPVTQSSQLSHHLHAPQPHLHLQQQSLSTLCPPPPPPPPLSLHHHHHLTLNSHHHNHNHNHHHTSHHLHNDYVHSPRTDGSVYSSPFSSIDSETDSGKLIVNSLNRADTLTTKSNLSQSQASLSHCSGLNGEDDHWFLDPTPPPSSVLKMPSLNWDLTSLTASRRRPLMYNSSDYLSQTPSPNDSVIVELEALLREKDSEISYLRETLERNEQVIFKVYEEKGQSWEREFKKLKSQYELNLQNYQQRANRAEQMISLQSKQNQVDREMIEQNCETTRKKVDSLEAENAELKNELTNLKEMVDELKWSLCERNGEVALLKSSIRDTKVDLNCRSTELSSLRAKLKETTDSLDESKHKVTNLEKELTVCQDNCNNQIQSMGQRLSEVVKQLDDKMRTCDTLANEKRELQSQLNSLQIQLNQQQTAFNKERDTWSDEKEKVLRYQRQLQANYRKMLSANKILEDLAGILRTKQQLNQTEESSC